MENFCKKKYIAILGILTATSAQAAGPDYKQNTMTECCQQCCTPTSCCAPRCCDIPDVVLVRGELLYWRPELCGLESAFGDTTIATTISTNAITTTTVIESQKDPRSRWDLGFRVGAEMWMNCYLLEADWTHFNGRATFRDGGQHGRWTIKYDVIDLIFGGSFCTTPCVHVTPFIGVRGARIKQKLNSHLEALFTAVIGDTFVVMDKNDKENFWGIGPELGIKADWDLGCNFSLYGSFDFVSYYGNVKGKHFDSDTFTRTVSVCNGRSHRCFSSIGTDLALGLRWDECWCYCGCEITFMLNLGVEQHRIYDFSDLGSDGTLSLDGGVAGAGIGFRF